MSARRRSIHLASWALRALSLLMLSPAITAGSRSFPSPAAHDCQHGASALTASRLATSIHGEDSATRRTHHPEASDLTRMLTLRARATSQHDHSPPCSITRRSTGASRVRRVRGAVQARAQACQRWSRVAAEYRTLILLSGSHKGTRTPARASHTVHRHAARRSSFTRRVE